MNIFKVNDIVRMCIISSWPESKRRYSVGIGKVVHIEIEMEDKPLYAEPEIALVRPLVCFTHVAVDSEEGLTRWSFNGLEKVDRLTALVLDRIEK